MPDEEDLRTSVGEATSRQTGSISKGHISPGKNTKGSGEMGKGLRGINYEERLKALKLQSLEKRRIRNDNIQPYRPESNSTVQNLQKDRTKKVTT